MYRYSHILPITRHNNVHYPLQNVIKNKSWKKKPKTKEPKYIKKVPKTKI